MREIDIPRYSPQPIEAYSRKVGGRHWAGPAFSSVLRDNAEAWNLAWLSHPYEVEVEHPDPEFTLKLRGTVAAYREALRRPPSQFWQAFEPTARTTALYRTYGEGWLATVAERAQLTWSPAYQSANLPLAQASSLLRKYVGARI